MSPARWNSQARCRQSRLLLKDGIGRKNRIQRRGAPPEPPSALIELTNGDLLPATIESLDEQNLTVISPEAGTSGNPAGPPDVAQFGIQRRKVIYRDRRASTNGPDSGENARTGLQQRSSSPTDRPLPSRKLSLPRQFILRFTLIWEEETVPNFQIYFADPLTAKGEPCDRYYLQFGGAGLGNQTRGDQGNTLQHHRFNSTAPRINIPTAN